LNPGGTDIRTSAVVSPEVVLKSSELPSAGGVNWGSIIATAANPAQNQMPLVLSPPSSY
jgi:hypothetical protein